MLKTRSFFNDIETIKVYDELAQFLGAIEDGVIEFTYTDIVKSAGHSCGTVAGAYLIALKGLQKLYPDTLPKRGDIKIEMRKPPRENNCGVVASVLSSITGATSDFGFGGIPTGKFNRRDLLFFDVNISSDVCLTRLDNGKKVFINYKPQKVVNPMKILKSAIMPDSSAEDIKSFPDRFQKMVQTVFDNADSVIEIS